MDTVNNSTTNNNRPVNYITILFLLIAMVCLIVNYSTARAISWSLYPIGGLIIIMASLFPLLILKKYKAFGAFVGLTVTVIPYLYLIQTLVATKGWFIPLALPIALLSLLALGISLMAFTSKKINKITAAAVAVFMFGVIVNYGVGVFVNRFLNENNGDEIIRVAIVYASVILSLILMIIAFSRRKGKK